MQAWMRIAVASVFFVVGCSLQMEAPRETVAWFAARPTAPAPVPGDSVNTPIDDPQVISSADFYNMQAYQYVCMQVSGADGKFGTPVQEMGSEQTSGSVTALFSKFTIPKLWVGRKYSIRVFGFKSKMEVCPFDFKGVSDFAQLGVLDTFVVPDKPSEVIIPVNFVESSGVEPNPLPVSPVINSVTISPLSNVVTPGQSVTFQATASVTSPVALTYTWYKGTGSNSSVCPSTATQVYSLTTSGVASYTTPTADTNVSGTRIYYCVIASALGVSSKESAWAQVDVSSVEVTGLSVGSNTSSGITITWNPPPAGYQTVVSWAQGNDPNMNEPIGCSANNFTGTGSPYIHTGVEPGKWYRYRICTKNGSSVSPGVVTPAVQAIFPTDPCTGDLYSKTVLLGTVCPGPESQQIELVPTTAGFPIWREQGGQHRILNATGIVNNGWQQTYVISTDFTDDDAINSIAGRVCPEKIHDPGHPNGYTAGCLYYDQGYGPQALNSSSGTTGAPGIDYLESWNISNSGGEEEAAFFEGNIATCNNKGMRLPVIYETDIIDIPSAAELPGSGPPAWNSSNGGVPSLGSYTWTATARRDPSDANNHKDYFTWHSGMYSTAPYDEANTDLQPAVRCVLPAFYSPTRSGSSNSP